jgi:murein DD-endopeptidase MepM/ murein hydrolase activator NlpD
VAFKKITIMFLSEGARKVRQIKVPKCLFTWLVLAAFCGGGFLTWMVRDYREVKSEVPELSRLRKENRQQRVQLLALAQKIDQVSLKMQQLQEFDHKLKVMVNMEVGEEEGSFVGVGGSTTAAFDPDQVMEKSHRNLVRLMHQSLETLDDEIEICTREKKELSNYLENQKAMLRCTPSVWPTKGWISSSFGQRISPFTNQKEFHQGLDICARTETPVVAPADGVVASLGSNHGYGKMLTLKHGYGLKTRYAHLHKILVKKGEYVKRGQTIALVGNTGRTTGPHLHYEVHLNGMPVNPMRYILN